MAVIALAAVVRPAGAQQHPAEQYGFGFQNFTTPILPWDSYRRSFFGIPSDTSDLRAALTAPFDVLFYHEVYKTQLAATGNCFGMSLLSLMMNRYGGYLGFCCPPGFYEGDLYGGGGPADPELRRAIGIMHGRQVSAAAIRTYLEQFRDGHSQNGAFGAALAREWIAKEGACIVSITKKMSPQDGGHAMIAYKVTEEPSGSGNHRIWVVDPNRLWKDTSASGRGWYTGVGGAPPKNYIECRRSGGGTTWQFRMAGGLSDWPTDRDDTAGMPLGRGNLIIIPGSVAGPTGRVPTSLGLSVLELAGEILISSRDGSGATIRQVTDGAGRRLFDPATGLIDWNAATGIRSMVPWYPSRAGVDAPPFPFELYWNDGAIPSARIDFDGGTAGATLAVGNNRGYVRLVTAEPGVRASLRFTGLGSASPTVVIENVSKPARFDLEVVHAPEPGSILRRYTLSGVDLSAGGENALRLALSPTAGVAVTGLSATPAMLDYVQLATAPAKRFRAASERVIPAAGAHIPPDGWRRLPNEAGE